MGIGRKISANNIVIEQKGMLRDYNCGFAVVMGISEVITKSKDVK